MQNSLKLFLTLFLFISTQIVFAAATPSSVLPDALVKETVQVLMTKDHIPGMAVLVTVEGKPYAYYFGYANEETKVPVTKQTIFEIGSLSKIMTSVLFAQEMDFDKMRLTDPVTKYLPALPEKFSKITLQQLATHTSGLPYNVPTEVQTEKDVQQYLAHYVSDHDPGQMWVYSNLGIGVLGSAVESSTGKSFDELYRRHILNPLGMMPLGTQVPAKLKKYYAYGYTAEDQPARLQHLTPLPEAFALKASAGDMQRFLNAAIGLPGTPPRVLYPLRMTQAVYVKLPDRMQGLAWELHPLTPTTIPQLLNDTENKAFDPTEVQENLERPTYHADMLMDKTGATAGFRAYIAVIPEKKAGVVILMNKYVENGDMVAAARKILFALTNLYS